MNLYQKRGLKNMPQLNTVGPISQMKRGSAKNMMLNKLTVLTSPEKLKEKREGGNSALVQRESNFDDENFIQIEDFDGEFDQRFIDEWLRPYLKDIYGDLKMRSNMQDHLDKVNFIEYTKLPGIINDRLHVLFSNMGSKFKRRHTEINKTSAPLESSQSKDKDKVEEYVHEQKFIDQFIKIFIGDVDQKMKFTFEMYDFDGDGYISPEDIRIMMSYMPFKRNVQLLDVQNIINRTGSRGVASPMVKKQPERKKEDEGLYKDDEGKSMAYVDRLNDQDDIKVFLDKIFHSGYAGCNGNQMNYKQYEYINKSVSSEMFYSLMAILHERLPCAAGFFRARKKFRRENQQGILEAMSPVALIASPKMIRGLSITKNEKNDQIQKDDKFSIRIKNHKPGSTRSLHSRSGSSHINNRTMGKQSDANLDQPDSATKFNQTSNYTTFQNQNFEKFGMDNPTSPHKLTQGNKMRRYEEAKDNQTNGGTFADNLSPTKGFGIRTSIGGKNFGVSSPLNISSSSPVKTNNASAKGLNINKINNKETFDSPILAQDSPDQAIHQKKAPIQGFGDYDKDLEKNAFAGQLFLKTKTERLKEHWGQLSGNELYFYRKQGDTDHRLMHILTGTFIKEMAPEHSEAEDQEIYPVKIVLPPNKSRILYFLTKEMQSLWLTKLRTVIGDSNMFDFYNLENNIGKGQFGLVKLATHRKNGQKVAIKIVNKKDMKPIEIYQQRREIDVLKMCQHPSICSMVDLFENCDYYYIILEYMQGKDMFDYIQIRNFHLSEKRVKELAYQIGQAIGYLHNYGIVHRDLKLENIMMSDNTEQSVPKLVDFGLAKMIGPNEKASEPFGTLGYVAPEILKKQPYSVTCDLWSFGCIIYALLSGSLPFDHESQKETIKMTLNKKLEFDLPCWKDYSAECKDILVRLLDKDPSQRINLKNTMNHKWFDGMKDHNSISSASRAKRKITHSQNQSISLEGNINSKPSSPGQAR